MDTRQLISSISTTSVPEIINGYVSPNTVPTLFTDEIYVIGKVDGASHGPVSFPAIHGTALPKAYDPVTLQIDDQDVPTIAWWGTGSEYAPPVTSFDGRTGVVTLQASDVTGALSLFIPTVATGATPSGANEQNLNRLSAPTSMYFGNVSVANSGYNAIPSFATVYDPNGWCSVASPSFSVPPGAYKLDYNYTFNYIGSPAVNVNPAVMINGTGNQLALGLSTNALNSYQPIAGTQIIIASTAPTSLVPAVLNSTTPNAGAAIVTGMWILTRVN